MACLWHRTFGGGGLAARFVADEQERLSLSALLQGSALGHGRAALGGASVIVPPGSQLEAAIALLELDGWARRIVLCPPDLDPKHLPFVLASAEVTGAVGRRPIPELAGLPHCVIGPFTAPADRTDASVSTEWILFTSGTTGRPKMVVHTLETLIGAISPSSAPQADIVWSTFYDIRRYGGLQILLRALIGGSSIVLSSRQECAPTFVARAKAAGVTHISGTPSHWRQAILSAALAGFAPRYVRLSGETADQAILDALRGQFPDAVIAHAFASTEAGVAFEVRDALAGVPVDMLIAGASDVAMRICDCTLRISSSRTALRYLGEDAPPLRDAEGFVDTKDMLERRGERYYFVGRSDAVINVGGLKVFPEEVEAVLNQHPLVRLALVRGQRSPLVGAVVVADVILHESTDHREVRRLEAEILQACRDRLPWHKVPAALHFVPSLAISAAGKLVRGIA